MDEFCPEFCIGYEKNLLLEDKGTKSPQPQGRS